MEHTDGIKDNGSRDKDEVIYTYNRELFYHFDREKGFSQSVDYQNPSNQVIIKHGWDSATERLEAIKEQVIAGKLSPVAFYMEKILMDVPMLAAYMGLSKWRIRRHMQWKAFRKIKPEILERYAALFEIPVKQLTHPEFLN